MSARSKNMDPKRVILMAICVSLMIHAIVLAFADTWNYGTAQEISFVNVGVIEEEVEVEEPKTLEEEIADRVNSKIENLLASNQAESTSELKNFSSAQEEAMKRAVEDKLRELEKEVQASLDSGKVVRRNEEPHIVTNDPTQDLDNYNWFEKSYSGSVTARVDVPGRKALDVPIPGYKCKEGGAVKIGIEVDQQGYVVKAEVVDANESSTECLKNEALSSAKRARFHAKSAAPKKSEGTILFLFIPQRD